MTHDQEEALVLSNRICLMNQARVEQVATPQTLYFEPDTRFVAEFLGESNLLECHVTPASSGRGMRVRVDIGGQQFGFETSTGAPGPALLLLRPESVEVASPSIPHHDGGTTLTGTLAECTFLGAMTRLKVDVGGITLKLLQRTASLQRLREFVVGAQVALWIDPARSHVLKT